MKNLLKIISWIVLSVLMVIMTAAFICPMTIHGAAMETETSSSLCQSIGSANPNMIGVAGCAGSHLAAIGQLLGDLPYVMNVLSALGLLAIVYYLFSRNFLDAIIRPLSSRLRHFYLYYRTSIKLLIEKKLLRYLGFLGNYPVVSSY